MRTFFSVLTALGFTIGGALSASLAQTPPRPAPVRTEVAPGVYLYQTAPYGPVGLDGNAVAIVTGDGVVVFDSNGTPAAARAVIADLRTLTPAPVQVVVNSHWHWDHWYGTEAYTAAFPRVQVVAHEKTRAMMAGPAIEFNRPGLETQLPAFITSLEKRVADADASASPPPNFSALRETLAQARDFLQQKRAVRHVLPTTTFSEGLTLHVGGREIRLLHYGRGVTPGDTLIYLPRERVLLTGDLLVNPVSFALSCYPTEWLAVLDRIAALDVALIVPGHGAPLRDRTLLDHTRAVFRTLLARGAALKAQGLDPDAARAVILPELDAQMAAMVGTDRALRSAFEVQLVDWFLHRVFEELDGPLSDAIAPIPVK